jgi:hypothetical protein
MGVKTKLFASLLLTTLLGSAHAQGADMEKARTLSAGVKKAKSIVDRAIRAAGGGPELVVPPDSDEDLESDGMALPIYVQASASLGEAAVSADQAVFSFLTGNIAYGNYSFSVACAKMGIGRSRISRANLAALMPPAGFLTAFGPELTDLVTELGLLKFTVGCP